MISQGIYNHVATNALLCVVTLICQCFGVALSVESNMTGVTPAEHVGLDRITESSDASAKEKGKRKKKPALEVVVGGGDSHSVGHVPMKRRQKGRLQLSKSELESKTVKTADVTVKEDKCAAIVAPKDGKRSWNPLLSFTPTPSESTADDDSVQFASSYDAHAITDLDPNRSSDIKLL